MILVTGATGKTGGQTLRYLLGKGAKVRALVRDPKKAARLQKVGIDVVVGDVASSGTVSKAVDGAEKIMLTLPNGPDQEEWEMSIVKKAAEAGVKHIVYLSSTESNPDNPRRIPQVHVKVQDALKESGMDWTILRPNFFMQNIFMFAQSIKEAGTFTFPSGDGTAAMCDVADIGEVAALCLMEDGHAEKSYDLTGPEVLSMYDVAYQMSQVLGTKVTYKPQPLYDFKASVAKVLKSQWHVEGVYELMQEMAEEGGLNYTTDTIQELLGRPPVSLAQFIEKNKAAFLPE